MINNEKKIKLINNRIKLIFIGSMIILMLTPIIPSNGAQQSLNQDDKGFILFDESHINPEADYSVANFASDRAMKEPVTLLREQGFKVRTNDKEITISKNQMCKKYDAT